MRIKRPKVIYDPVLQNPVDVDSFMPMIDAPEFQILRDRRQLSLTDLAFPAARHSRFEHSIGSFASTRRLADRWVVDGIINKEMRRALAGYALYHDIGHAAFSHVSEDFCGDHKIRTCELVRRLRPAIERANINFDLMYSLIAHQHPIHKAVSDKNIGMEKLDYLVRDGWYTGFGSPTAVSYLRKFTYFTDDHICVDEKMIEHVTEVQRFYMQMFKGVYLRKCLVIAQRTFHKMLYRAIQNGDCTAAEIPELTDAELLGRLALSKSAGVTHLYRRLQRRALFKEAVSIRSAGLERETRTLQKLISVIGVPEAEMQKFVSSAILRKDNHEGLENLEAAIARLLQLDASNVHVVPAMYADRFVSQDVMIYGSDGRLHSLRERRPQAFASMEEIARAHACVRVCVPDEYRERACKAAPDIYALIKEVVHK